MSSIKVGLLVVAAGRGVRFGADRPKQYLTLARRPLIVHTLEALAAGFPFSAVTVVIRAEDRALYDQAAAHLATSAAAALGPPAIGGATRQQSVLAGLEALAALEPDLVLIHDAVRPFPSPALIARAIEAADRHGAAAPGTAMSDTVKQVDADGRVLVTPPRSGLRAVQTPQAFRFPLILAAHRRAADAGVGDLTDDVAVAEWAGAPAYVFEGDPGNVKVTTVRDLEAAEARLTASLGETRVGQGFDVHAFAPGDHMWLCGVRIPHSAALSGHSDADVGLHALADALYGALAEGDIGPAFPALRPAVEGRGVEGLPRPCSGARTRTRRRDRPSRRNAHLRSAENRPASRDDARPRRRDRRPRHRPRRGQGDDDRAAWLRRPEPRASPASRLRPCGCP